MIWMICRHTCKLYHFTVANLVLPRQICNLTRRGKTKFATVKWYNLCRQIIQSQTCYPLICYRKMIQFVPVNHSNTNRVLTILIHSDKTHFQNVFVMLLRRVAKDVTSSLLSWHKMILIPQIFDVTANENARYKRNDMILSTVFVWINYPDVTKDFFFIRNRYRKVFNFSSRTKISILDPP